MKKVIVVNLHSFVDIITNSSTELFVCNTNKSLELVKELLEFMLEKWNELAAKGVWGDHYVNNDRYNLSDGKSKQPPALLFEEVFNEPYIYTEEMCNEGDRGYEYAKSENIGKIIIEGNSDNSIPYNMFEWIESAFNTGYDGRIHMG